MPNGAVIRPITTSFPDSGSFLLLTELLDQPRHRVGELRALALPMREPRVVDAQPLAAFRRLRVVEPDALDEAAVARAPRVRHHQVVERALFRAAAREPDDDHGLVPALNTEKGVILR